MGLDDGLEHTIVSIFPCFMWNGVTRHPKPPADTREEEKICQRLTDWRKAPAIMAWMQMIQSARSLLRTTQPSSTLNLPRFYSKPPPYAGNRFFLPDFVYLIRARIDLIVRVLMWICVLVDICLQWRLGSQSSWVGLGEELRLISLNLKQRLVIFRNCLWLVP